MVHQSRLRRNSQRHGRVDGRRHPAAPRDERDHRAGDRRYRTDVDRHDRGHGAGVHVVPRRGLDRRRSSTTTWRSPTRRSRAWTPRSPTSRRRAPPSRSRWRCRRNRAARSSVDEVPGLAATAMSTSVRTTTAPIVVERTMRWGPAAEPQYGAHGDKSTAGAALKWYFAEGSQGFFLTFLLLANPGDSVNTATVDWLIEGGAPVQRVYSLPPTRRTTINPGDDANVAGHAFGIVVTFAQPAVAERAMYFGMPARRLLEGRPRFRRRDRAVARAGSSPRAPPGRSSRRSSCWPTRTRRRRRRPCGSSPRTGVEVTRTVPIPRQRPAHGRHRGARSGGAGTGQRRGGDRRHRDAADRRRAGAVLARRAVGRGTRRTTASA